MSLAVLVTGAAGKTGREVIAALARRGLEVRALVHRSQQAEVARAAGAGDVAAGDARDPGDLARAMTGAEAVYHICPNVHPEEVEMGEAAVEAARETGVRRFVYHSVLHPSIEAMPHHWLKYRVEERLASSGIPFVILQPCAYMQNTLGQWAAIAARGELTVPYGVRTPMSLVDLRDVAEAAATVLTERGHEGATYELCGPAEITPEGMAAVLRLGLGRPVRAVRITVAEWEVEARTAGVDDYAVDALGRMFRWYDRNGFVGSPRPLGELLGRSPGSFEDFVRRTVTHRG